MSKSKNDKTPNFVKHTELYIKSAESNIKKKLKGLPENKDVEDLFKSLDKLEHLTTGCHNSIQEDIDLLD